MGSVLENWDEERVHNSDIKKIISWYNILIGSGITDFTAKEEEEEAKEEEKPQKNEKITTYKVKKGDTLTRIAKKHSVTISDIVEWNHLESDLIREGQELIIKK